MAFIHGFAAPVVGAAITFGVVATAVLPKCFAHAGRSTPTDAQTGARSAQGSEAMASEMARVARAADEIARLRTAINADRTVVDVRTSLIRRRAETIVERRDAGGTRSDASTFGALWSVLGVFGGRESVSQSTSSQWRSASVDTRILDLDPEESAGFDSRQRVELQQAQEALNAYVGARASEIARIKTLATDAFRALGRARQIAQASGGTTPLPRLSVEQANALLGAATDIRFHGRQTVVRCVSTSHPGWTTSRMSEATGSRSRSGSFASPLAIGNWFSSASWSESDWEQRRRFAYSESSCAPSVTERFEAEPRSASVDLAGLDEDVRAWARWAAATAVTEAPSRPDPHFGSPYYGRDQGGPLSFPR